MKFKEVRAIAVLPCIRRGNSLEVGPARSIQIHQANLDCCGTVCTSERRLPRNACSGSLRGRLNVTLPGFEKKTAEGSQYFSVVKKPAGGFPVFSARRESNGNRYS